MNLTDLTPEAIYRLAEELAGYTILGTWTEVNPKWIVRREPKRRLEDCRVYVFKDDNGDWFWRIGFGVIGVPGSTGTRAYRTPEMCQIAIDDILRRAAKAEKIILVDRLGVEELDLTDAPEKK